MLQQVYFLLLMIVCIIIMIVNYAAGDQNTISLRRPLEKISNIEGTVNFPIFESQLSIPYASSSGTTTNSSSTSASYTSSFPSSALTSAITASKRTDTYLTNKDITASTSTRSGLTSAISDLAVTDITSMDINPASASDTSIIISGTTRNDPGITSFRPIYTSAGSYSINKDLTLSSIPNLTPDSSRLKSTNSALESSIFASTSDSYYLTSAIPTLMNDISSSKSSSLVLPSDSSASTSQYIVTTNTNIASTISNLIPVTSSIIPISLSITTGDSHNSTSVPHLSDGTPLNVFATEAMSVPAIQIYVNGQISGFEAKTVFYNTVYKFLVSLDIPSAISDASKIAQAASNNNVLTLPMYFEAMGNAIINLLDTNGVKITPDLPRKYAIIIEKSILSTNIVDVEALNWALLTAFANFISSLGFNIEKVVDDLMHYFRYELRALSIH